MVAFKTLKTFQLKEDYIYCQKKHEKLTPIGVGHDFLFKMVSLFVEIKLSGFLIGTGMG